MNMQTVPYQPRKPYNNPIDCKSHWLPATAADLLGWRAVTNGAQPMHYIDANGKFTFYIGDWCPHTDANKAALLRQYCFEKNYIDAFAIQLAAIINLRIIIDESTTPAHLMINIMALDASAEQITRAACITLYKKNVWDTNPE